MAAAAAKLEGAVAENWRILVAEAKLVAVEELVVVER